MQQPLPRRPSTVTRAFFSSPLQEFKSQDAAGDLFAEERARKAQEEEARRLAVPGLANPYAVLPDVYKAVDDDL